MTKEEIIRMAREAGLPIERDDDGEYIGCLDFFDRAELVRRVAAAEREACARLCEIKSASKYFERAQTPMDCANAIRARGYE